MRLVGCIALLFERLHMLSCLNRQLDMFGIGCRHWRAFTSVFKCIEKYDYIYYTYSMMLFLDGNRNNVDVQLKYRAIIDCRVRMQMDAKNHSNIVNRCYDLFYALAYVAR